MKKILNIIAVASILYSCSKDNVAIEESNNKNGSKSSVLNHVKIVGKEYVSQLPYLDSHSDFLTFNIENDLNHKMNDPKIDWKTINTLYSSELNPAEKQFIIYIIFAKKDLIGIQNSNPTKEQNDLIANYTRELVNSKYIGYCILYNALSTLNSDPVYAPLVEELSKQIISYSKEETFHIDFLSRSVGREPYLDKIKENYSYLDKIKSLSK